MKNLHKIVGVHNGRIHIDETKGCAFRKVFLGETHTYIRSRDEAILAECDILIDVGMQFDGIKFFDHHQYKFGKSAAGLTWDYVQEELGIKGKYPKIDRMVDMIDKGDTGEQAAPEFSLPFVVDSMNAKKTFSEDQDKAFEVIVDFLCDILVHMKDEQDKAYEAEAIIAECSTTITRKGKNVLVFDDGMVSSWDHIVNGDSENYAHISIVVWQNPHDKEWKAQVPPIVQGSQTIVDDGFTPSEKAIFVHENKFFSVWENLDDLLRHQ